MDYLIAVYTGRKIYTLGLKPGVTATLGDAQNDTLLLPDSGLGGAYLVLACDAGGVRILSRQPMKFGDESATNRVLSAGDIISITGKITLAVFESRSSLSSALSLDGFNELRIGRSYNNNDICLKDSSVSSRHAVLRKINGRWVISDLQSRNGTFVNGELAPVDEEISAENVSIFICGYMFHIQNNMLHFTNTPGEIEFAPETADSLVAMPTRQKAYPFFQRSPRIRNSAGKASFEITSPPNAGTKPNITWLTVLLPPIMMVSVMGFVASMTKNFNMLMYSVPMSLMSVVLAFVNNRNNMKKWMKNNGLAIEKYTEYLAETDKQITDSEGAFISALSITNPGVNECLAIARNVSRRLWERTPRDKDFLSVRLGTGSIDSNVKIKLPSAQMSVEDNPFIKQAEEIRDRHTVLTGVPVCHSLLEHQITGLAGRRDAVIRTAWRIIMDLTTHQSYEDVRIMCVYPEEEREKWEWMRWLPHIWDSKNKKRCLVCTRDEARPMLREAAELIKTRTRNIKPGQRETLPEMPYRVLILADRTLTESSGEVFFPDNPALGFSAVYAYGDIGSLPGECQSVIICDTPASIQNTEPDSGTTTTPFTPDKISVNVLDEFARALAPVHLVSAGGGNKMPSAISFLQGVEADTIESLDVLGRWRRANSAKSLATPMGIRENGDTFYFNILDGQMGPHGLTVGTAGSGKSETLTTLLLSMALTYSPEDVNFALIEFKGNDLSNILKPLPHVAGVVSNLNDPTTIIRGLRSLEGEIKRRQLIFEATDIPSKNLPTYQKYQKSHPELGLDPLPYLIVVIDEFAEFITQFPEFNDEIASIARVGRSLGMYMILTMQSPQGVIKGQVNSNITFRICMRTANASDSKEILGTEDAFKLSAPGRTIVKVRADIYEHIQTFYAKAPYNPGSGQKSAVGEIRLVALDGKKTKPDIYDKTMKAGKKDEKTQGALVVQSIIDTAKQNNIRHAPPVWTEPLPQMLALETLTAGHEAFDREAKTWSTPNKGLAVTVGLVDEPKKQVQYPLVLDFMETGHQVLYGAPTTGKTSFLQTVILSAALAYTPEQVNFVILDYGSFILKTFETLPHTIIAADPTDEEKVKKARDFLRGELSSRRKLFSAEGVANLEAYREAVGKPIPAIIVVVDNMASLNNQSPEMTDVLNQAARDGGGLGIYLMITSGNTGGFMYKISQYVKSNHTLQMTEKTDYKPLVGGEARMEPGHFPGRGLTKGALEYQTALCVDGATENERNKKLKALCADMAGAWTGKSASLEAAAEEAAAEIQPGELSSSEKGVEIGMKKGTREPVEFVFEEMNGCVISGAYGGGKSNVLGMIAKALEKDENTTLYVYEEKTFIEKLCPKAKTMHKPEEADEAVKVLADEYEKRDYDSKGRIVFCIDDFYNFYQDITQESADILEVIARSGADKGIYIYAACSTKGMSVMGGGGAPLFSELLKRGNAIVTGGGLGECQAFKTFHQEGDMFFGKHEGCIIHSGKVTELRFGRPEGA
ncbi:MAG: type VII secretion protein EssC [Synergistaceae bacterium]|nr:type VII secretion protein EssC [Synergistaceae bacterium]